MTFQEIDEMIGGFGLPYAYYSFPETGQQPPFITWYYNGISDLYADGINYQKILPLVIEFYSDEKDIPNELIIEAALTERGFSYGKEETYIDSEHMHETIYTLEVLNNGQ